MYRPTRSLVVLLAVLLVACGDDPAPTTTGLLPDGAGNPRAYTESFLAAHPGASLRLTHTAILHLGADAAEDDTGGPGRDAVPYFVERDGTLALGIDASAAQVVALVLRDAAGRETVVDRGGVQVAVTRGRHVLDVLHAPVGAPGACAQTIFVYAPAREDAGWELRVSANCPNCSFDNSTLDKQCFDDTTLSGSTFHSSVILDSTFRNALMVGCDFSGQVDAPTTVRGAVFTGADLTMARFDQAGIFETAFGGTGAAQGANLAGASFGRVEDGLPLWTEIGSADFRNANLSGAGFVIPFSGSMQLEGADLSQATFAVASEAGTTPTCSECTFGLEPGSGRTTSLAGATLGASGAVSWSLSAGTDLTGVDFTGASFTDGSFTGLTFADANLQQADLAGATLDDSVFDGAHFAGANLTGASARAASLIGAHLAATGNAGATLPAAVLDQAVLDGANAYTANLQGVSLAGASLVGANLNYTDLRGARLPGAKLGVPENSEQSAATLVGAYMPNVDLEDADLRGVDLSGAHLYGDAHEVNLDGALLDGADLTGAICSGSSFTDASLTGTIFNQAQMVNTTFDGADLAGAIFDSAYLQGADFTGAAHVEGARLDNAAVATTPGSWTFTDQNGMPVVYSYGATQLGPFATDGSVTCPDAESGPCTSDKLNPVDDGPFPPVPTCVPVPPNYNNCTAPAPPTPTPTPPP